MTGYVALGIVWVGGIIAWATIAPDPWIAGAIGALWGCLCYLILVHMQE